MAEPMIDSTLARFQHTGIALFAFLAALAPSLWLIVLAVGVAGAAAVGGTRISLPILIYERFLRPAVEPSPTEFVDEEPERFGLLIVTIVLAAGLVARSLDGSMSSGWLVWGVVLHEFAAAFGLCLACRLHALLPTS